MAMASNGGGRPRLSIVIPATDVAAFEDTLVSVLENRPAECEIVATLTVPYGDPWNIGDEVRFVPAPTGATLVDCVNVGVASSAGEIVHVLAAGWRATEGWAEAALARFEDPRVAAVAPLSVAAEDRTRIVAGGIHRTRGGRSIALVPPRNHRRVDAFTSDRVRTPSAPMLEAGFWRVATLPRSGFTKACGDRLAAADMSARIAAAGDRAVVEAGSHVVEGPSGRRASSYREGLRAERLFWRSLASEAVLPALLAHVAEVVRHAVATAPLGTLPMLMGRLTALVQFGSCLGRARELLTLRREAAARRQDVADHAGRTLRIDEGHGLPTRPRRAGTEVPQTLPQTGRQAPLRRSA